MHGDAGQGMLSVPSELGHVDVVIRRYFLQGQWKEQFEDQGQR